MDNNELTQSECLICHQTFATKSLARHIGKKHNIKFETYILQYKYNNQSPLCACGCKQKTIWNVVLKDFAKYCHLHHPRSRIKSDEEKAKIGHTNSIIQTKRFQENPELCKKYAEILKSGRTPEAEQRRIEATKEAYNNMTIEEKQEKFSVRLRNRWSSGQMISTKEKANNTLRERFKNNEYDLTERNKKVSERITQMYLEGKMHRLFKHSEYFSLKMQKTFHCRSSFELKFMQLLDSLEEVTFWEYEFCAIKYIFLESEHRYIPDFHVIKNNEHFLVEVKPLGLRLYDKNVAKRNAAIEFCKQQNWQYLEWQTGDSF